MRLEPLRRTLFLPVSAVVLVSLLRGAVLADRATRQIVDTANSMLTASFPASGQNRTRTVTDSRSFPGTPLAHPP